MKYAKYIEVNETATVDGKPVRCHEITDEEHVEVSLLSTFNTCQFYSCAFRNMIPCVVPCLSSERKDGKTVYYELIEKRKN